MTKRRGKFGSKSIEALDRIRGLHSPAPSMTQLRMFLMVVDEGSFAAAARKAGRATSVISYSIAKLETQLGISLFKRDKTRRPHLTEEGWTILSEVRTIVTNVDSLSAKARGLSHVGEPEVFVALDGAFPSCRIVSAVKAFRSSFPTVPIHVRVEASGTVAQLVLTRAAMIGVHVSLIGEALIDDIEAVRIGSIDLVPVSAPGHSVAGGGAFAEDTDNPQLVLADRSTNAPRYRSGPAQPWRLTDLTSMQLLLKEGIGWGYLPAPMISADIENGQLVALSGQPRRTCVLHAIHRKDTPLGPVASFFVSSLVHQISGERVQRPQIARATIKRAAKIEGGSAQRGVARLIGKI